jgi:dTMP kinase
MMAPGRLIVFEGIDGTGKTTQLSLLAKVLSDRGLPVVSTREPTDGAYGKKIRELYRNRASISREEELELFLADRREHVRELLNPALQAGKIVLCDRYVLSTVAYQGAAGLDTEEILAQNDFAPTPDAVLLFQATPETGIARITGKRGEALNDFEQAATLARVAEIFATLDQPYIHRVDATGSITTIHALIVKAVEPIIQQYQSRYYLCRTLVRPI